MPLRLPEAPALAATPRGAVWLTPDGEIEELPADAVAGKLVAGVRPYVCHARATARRLGMRPFEALDVLELFAFVRPAAFCLPTPRGLAEGAGIAIPDSHEREAAALPAAAHALLAELAATAAGDRAATGIAGAMTRGGWAWGEAVLAALGGPAKAGSDRDAERSLAEGLRVWHRLADWEEGAPEPPPENRPVEAVEARARLVQLLGKDSEKRDQQADYASTAARAFAPRDKAGEPHVVIAEAGTGIGKTLGYIAPASLWAEKNRGTVWISTYTRNLQRQLDAELDRLCPLPAEKENRVVVRKGRENYLCLLNYEEAVERLPTRGGAAAVPLGLMARWALATRDGDMVGGDFPAWLADMLGRNMTVDLTDTRGECIYSACRHYGRCFIEHTQRRARRADIVVANHALVMVNAAMGGGEGAAEGTVPTRYVFDEGHHLFDAADSAFSARLSGQETAELRRWLVGAEAGSRSRSRGLKARVGDLIAGEQKAEEHLDATLQAARGLPGAGWLQRIAGGGPQGPAEAFLALARQQVYARDRDSDSPYSLETEPGPPVAGLLETAKGLADALRRLNEPLVGLVRELHGLLDAESDELDTASRTRIEAAVRSIERRGLMPLAAWRSMLASLAEETPEGFVDWFSVERRAGSDVDVGLNRHWVDPMRPFAETVLLPAHGALITSATLTDRGGTGDDPEAARWESAAQRTGARHLNRPAALAGFASPFDYARATRVLVVGDVRRDDPGQVAAAYRELFRAAGGGGLGLFTAIKRLRAVHERIAADLDAAGIPLLAQHVDPLDTGTLVDIFRAEEDACLLGTDAVRDGVDVPGRSLRLIVFDRVPWPRPDILHRARREAFGGRAYDEMLTRLRLKQAYGRLIRRASDRGVFVMLDRAVPSRLLDAFPDGVEVRRTGLADAVETVRTFLTGADGG